MWGNIAKDYLYAGTNIQSLSNYIDILCSPWNPLQLRTQCLILP